MLRSQKAFLLITIIPILSSCTIDNKVEHVAPEVKLIPAPARVLLREGTLTLNQDFWVVANVGNPITAELAEELVNGLRELTSKNVGITDLFSTRKHKQSIQLEIKNNFIAESKEAYSIELTSRHIKITSGSERGIFYGIQSLMQILHATKLDGEFVVQKMNIRDQPRYDIRALLINPANYSTLDLKNLILKMSVYKMNRLFFMEATNNLKLVKKYCEERNIKVSRIDTIPNDLALVSSESSKKEWADIFDANIANTDTKGILLDLRSDNDNNESLVILAAEIAWSDNTNRDFTEIYKEK